MASKPVFGPGTPGMKMRLRPRHEEYDLKRIGE
jgi:hypothetical protein